MSNILNKLNNILIPLISFNPSISLIYSLLRTCKLLYITIISSELIWIIITKEISCSFCYYQYKYISKLNKKQQDKDEEEEFKELQFKQNQVGQNQEGERKELQYKKKLNSKNVFYWYETVKSIIAQRKLRRQWGIVFTSQILTNNGKKCSFKRNNNIFSYDGSQLVHILDSFLISESKILLSSNHKYPHWHDISEYSLSLQQQFISEDKICSPPLELGKVRSRSKTKIHRLSGWMELEGPRFITKLPSHHKSYTLHKQVLNYLEIDEYINKDFQEIIEKNSNDTAPSSMENIEEDIENPLFFLESHLFFDRNFLQNRYNNTHYITSRRISNSTNPTSLTKIALDENTCLTGQRTKLRRVAYSPQVISTTVLESLDGLFGNPNQSVKDNTWTKKISSMFQSIWSSKLRSQSIESSDELITSNPADWILLQLFYSVGGNSPENCTIKWYTTFISNTNNIQELPDSRLVIVAFCFDKNGMVLRICGLTSSKSSFRVFGY